jgi:hypothetical protein
MTHRYQTALRSSAQQQLTTIGTADILFGIPCYNNDTSIHHVIQQVSQGLAQHYPDCRAVLMVADGGSTDQTQAVAAAYPLPPTQAKIITRYQGIGGKGSALRAIFEAACQLQVQACATVDADLRSITPDWVNYLLEPVLEQGVEFVTPLYARYKYDGTITNNIVYPLTRALYGKQIRQPIGGDFAFSQGLAQYYQEQAVWETDVARFGIDIWMTLSAIAQGASLGQVRLGAKIHDAKDPAAALGPMFRQVCGTLFSLLEPHAPVWMPVKGSQPVPISGLDRLLDPEPIAVDHARMVQDFQAGLSQCQATYRALLSSAVLVALTQASALAPPRFEFSPTIWVRVLYEFAAAYHHQPAHRTQLLNLLTPLYLGQVASFITRTRTLTFAAAEAEVDALAQCFEHQKPYFLTLWQDSSVRSQILT